MSRARDRIAATLSDQFGFYSPGHRSRVADLLMEVVRDTVARELRAVMADRTTVAKLDPVEKLTCFIVKVEDLLPRIAALDTEA